MKRNGLLSVLPVILVLACGSGPKPVEQAPEQPAPAVQPAAPVAQPAASAPQPVPPPPPDPQPVQSTPAVEEVFDPATITEEKFAAAKADVQALIGDLNRIIKAKNYNAWISYLSASYLEEISSQSFLEEKTEELYKRDLIVATNLGRDPKRVSKKILKTPKDYFDNVVVPSRSNDRMDDIAFVSENRVKAYTMDNRGQRLVLYDLEIIDNKWKIIN